MEDQNVCGILGVRPGRLGRDVAVSYILVSIREDEMRENEDACSSN